MKKGKIQPDPTLRDTETIPLKEDVQTYFEREVCPSSPMHGSTTPERKTGYEIPFTRHFYRYEPPRPSDTILSEIIAIEKELDTAIRELFHE